MGEITFLDYDKITDTLMFFTKEVTLGFCVNLTRKNQKNDVVHFHSEYSYKSEYLNNKSSHSIKRNFSAYFVINDSRDYSNSLILRAQDLSLLQMIMNANIIPWLIGSKRIYAFDNDKKLIIKGKWSQVNFPLSEYKYLSFAPIIITYQDQTMKEGIRITINDKNNFIDIDINKFMEFYYYICNTDLYGAAIGLLNYVKTMPYGINEYQMGNGTNIKSYDDSYDWNEMKRSGKRNSFFDSL